MSQSPDRSYKQSQEINVRDIPKFQFEINNEELKSCIKELNFNHKTLDKNFQRLKKEVENRPTQNNITESLVLINSHIEIDPSLSKLLKSKQVKKEELGSNPINASSLELGKKINQISESVTMIYSSLKGLEKKVNDMQFSFTSSLNEKINVVQQQIDETNSKMSSQFFSTNQKIELAVAEFGDKLREVETKTLWQINDCKNKLTTCINDQYVKDSIKEVEGRMITRMKQESIKQGAVDPQRIQKIEQHISKNEKQVMNQITETNYKIQTLKEHVQISVVTKKQNGQQKVEAEKRLGIINSNLNDMIRRVRNTEEQLVEGKNKANKMQMHQESVDKQLVRMNGILQNLKIGDDFQKMLQKMDPHKICALDDMVTDLKLQQERLNKNLELAKKQIDRVRSKTEFVNILTPNTGGSKMSKEDIEAIIHEYFVNNMFAKKIQNLQAQFLEVKAFPDMVNEINKKIARMQKQTDTHNLEYELKGLQEYLKKQVLIVNNRINNIEMILNDNKRKRPTSALQSNGSDKKLGSSLSYKKLTPVNCISCYQNPMMTPQRKSLSKRY